VAQRPYDLPVWREVRLLVLRRDGFVCQIRGPRCVVEASDCDHVVPWQAGGAWYDPENLRAACEPCNRGRVRRPVERRPSRVW
jgi:5-methylcytosine-specific restriction enzyme A